VFICVIVPIIKRSRLMQTRAETVAVDATLEDALNIGVINSV